MIQALQVGGTIRIQPTSTHRTLQIQCLRVAKILGYKLSMRFANGESHITRVS